MPVCIPIHFSNQGRYVTYRFHRTDPLLFRYVRSGPDCDHSCGVCKMTAFQLHIQTQLLCTMQTCITMTSTISQPTSPRSFRSITISGALRTLNSADYDKLFRMEPSNQGTYTNQKSSTYTTAIHTASTLLSSPALLKDLTAMINTNFQTFYAPIVPNVSEYQRLPEHSSLPEELGSQGFMIVMFDGQLPIVSSGAKLWDPNIKVASNTRSESENKSALGLRDGSEWERIMTTVRQEEKYKGKGLAKGMVRRVEAECVRRYREREGRSGTTGQGESDGRVKCITRCVKGIVSGFHGKLGYVMVAEKAVPGMEDSGIKIWTMERFVG